MRKGIGFSDYWNMYKKKGARLPFDYFFQNHLFDILYGVDTNHWLPKESFDSYPDNYEHGEMYMCSWSSEIKFAFNELKSRLGEDFDKYLFVDLGCGKGKALLLWDKLITRNGSAQKIIGIEYYKPLFLVAERNLHKCGSKAQIVLGDVAEIDLAEISKHIILYMYNPFDEVIIRRMLDKNRECDVYVVYNYPVYAQELELLGFRQVSEKRGWHPNAQTRIYHRPKT